MEAERWGDEVLQPVPRRLFWTGVCARPDAIASYSEGSRLPLPGFVQRLAAPRIARVARWRNRGGAEQARKDLAALPAQLDQVDAWIAEGVMGGAEPNAADLQIAPSIAPAGDDGRREAAAGGPSLPRARAAAVPGVRRATLPAGALRLNGYTYIGVEGKGGRGTMRREQQDEATGCASGHGGCGERGRVAKSVRTAGSEGADRIVLGDVRSRRADSREGTNVLVTNVNGKITMKTMPVHRVG